jgi:hypothetical protein
VEEHVAPPPACKSANREGAAGSFRWGSGGEAQAGVIYGDMHGGSRGGEARGRQRD